MEPKIIESNEISLREIIEVLLGGIKVIIVFAVVGVLIAGTISFFILPDVYKGRVVLEVNDRNNPEEQQFLVDKYIAQIKSTQLLKKTIEDLNLVNKRNELLSSNSLKDMILVTNIEDTNLVSVVVSYSDAEIASNIANTLCNNFITHITESYQAQANILVSVMEEQLKIEEQDVIEQLQNKEEFLKNNKSIDQLNEEVNSLISQIIKYKEQYNTAETNAAADYLSLTVLLQSVDLDNLEQENQLAPFLEVDENLNYDFQIPIGELSGTEIYDNMTVLEIVNIQTRYITNSNLITVYEDRISSLEAELIQLQIERVNAEHECNSIETNLALANGAYNDSQRMYKEALIASVSDEGNKTVNIYSESYLNEKRVSPNTVQNLAMGLLLGLMMGVVLVLLRDYWRKTGKDE